MTDLINTIEEAAETAIETIEKFAEKALAEVEDILGLDEPIPTTGTVAGEADITPASEIVFAEPVVTVTTAQAVGIDIIVGE